MINIRVKKYKEGSKRGLRGKAILNLSKKSKKSILLLGDLTIIFLSYYLIMLFQYSSSQLIRSIFIGFPSIIVILILISSKTSKKQQSDEDRKVINLRINL